MGRVSVVFFVRAGRRLQHYYFDSALGMIHQRYGPFWPISACLAPHGSTRGTLAPRYRAQGQNLPM